MTDESQDVAIEDLPVVAAAAPDGNPVLIDQFF